MFQFPSMNVGTGSVGLYIFMRGSRQMTIALVVILLAIIPNGRELNEN